MPTGITTAAPPETASASVLVTEVVPGADIGPGASGVSGADGKSAGDGAAGVDVARLRAAVLRVSRLLRKHEVNLTPTQLSALSTVAREGPLRLGDLAAAERIAPSTLTRLIAALEAPGYIARGPVPGDARACQVTITPAGEAVLDQIRRETTSVLTESLLRLPPAELAALSAALPALEHLTS